jgi:hypothetical protein
MAFVIAEDDWPSELPGPMFDSSLRMKAGTNVKRRRTQGGRVELRRFGERGPDEWSLVFRFNDAELIVFAPYYNDSLDLGTMWFAAPWISRLGYGAGHYAKIMGYPQERHSAFPYQGFVDLHATVLVAPISV